MVALGGRGGADGRDLGFREIFTAAVVGILPADRNFPVYDGWAGGLIGCATAGIAHSGGSPFPYLSHNRESSPPVPSSLFEPPAADARPRQKPHRPVRDRVAGAVRSARLRRFPARRVFRPD